MPPKSKHIVITGATGGIGTAFVNMLANTKCSMLLCDRDAAKLSDFAADIRKRYRINVDTHTVNLSDSVDITLLAERLKTEKKIDMFIAAAGYAEKTQFKDESIEAVMNMISVHSLSVVSLVHAVLPRMLKRKRGDIIAVSSLAAFIPAPGSSIYTATKSFINGFLESLYMEVHNKGIRVQSLCPGLTHTGFHTKEDVKRFDGIKGLNIWMDADEVVAASLDALGNGAVICIPGWVNKAIRKTVAVLPRQSYYALAEKLAKKNK